MRVALVKVNIETDNVVFAPFATCECVDVLCPFLDVFTASDMRIVRTMFQIDCLTPECQLVHPVAASSEDDVDNGTAIRLFAFSLHLLIGIGYATF